MTAFVGGSSIGVEGVVLAFDLGMTGLWAV